MKTSFLVKTVILVIFFISACIVSLNKDLSIQQKFNNHILSFLVCLFSNARYLEKRRKSLLTQIDDSERPICSIPKMNELNRDKGRKSTHIIIHKYKFKRRNIKYRGKTPYGHARIFKDNGRFFCVGIYHKYSYYNPDRLKDDLDDEFAKYYESILILVPPVEEQDPELGRIENGKYIFNCKNLREKLSDRGYHQDYEFDIYYLVKGYTPFLDFPKSLITKETNNSVYITIDVETTGLVIAVDRITEIAAIKYKGGMIVDKFQSLVFPQRHQFQQVVELTGITDEMLFDEPLIIDVLPKFIEFIGDDLLVAHNALFDIEMIYTESCRFGLPMFTNRVFDTLPASRKCLKGKVANYKLSTIKNYFGLAYESHRALDDCETCSAVYQYYCYKNIAG